MMKVDYYSPTQVTQPTSQQRSYTKFVPVATFLNDSRSKPWWTSTSSNFAVEDRDEITDWLKSGGPFQEVDPPLRF